MYVDVQWMITIYSLNLNLSNLPIFDYHIDMILSHIYQAINTYLHKLLFSCLLCHPSAAVFCCVLFLSQSFMVKTILIPMFLEMKIIGYGEKADDWPDEGS